MTQDKYIEQLEDKYAKQIEKEKTLDDYLHMYDERDFIGEAERSRAIGFAKWLAGSYSFGNITGLWYLHENTSKEYNEEELYELYLESFNK